MITLVSPSLVHRAEDYDLDPEVLAALWRMEDRHFWHRARNRWIARALAAAGVTPPARVLEVGCGGGAVASYLVSRGYQVTGIDTAEVLIRKADARCPAASFIAGNLEALPPSQPPMDVIAFFDVFEHLDEPQHLLQSALAHLRPGGLCIATVPALPELWSVVDRLAGHKKRYQPGELRTLLGAAGLTDVTERGIFRAMLPFLRRTRRQAGAPGADGALSRAEHRSIMVKDMRVPPLPLNAALSLCCTLERTLGFARARERAAPTLLATGRAPHG
jgi:SAM-dependent methyltransferase